MGSSRHPMALRAHVQGSAVYAPNSGAKAQFEAIKVCGVSAPFLVRRCMDVHFNCEAFFEALASCCEYDGHSHLHTLRPSKTVAPFCFCWRLSAQTHQRTGSMQASGVYRMPPSCTLAGAERRYDHCERCESVLVVGTRSKSTIC